MAKYDITYSCGHQGTVNIVGPVKDRESKKKWYEEEAVCPECYKKLKEENRQKINKESKEKNAEKGFTNLEGSEKQVAWAETIRANFVKEMEKSFEEILKKAESFRETEPDDKVDAQIKNAKETRIKVIAGINNKSSASWWIDHRDVWWQNLAKEIIA